MASICMYWVSEQARIDNGLDENCKAVHRLPNNPSIRQLEEDISGLNDRVKTLERRLDSEYDRKRY